MFVIPNIPVYSTSRIGLINRCVRLQRALTARMTPQGWGYQGQLSWYTRNNFVPNVQIGMQVSPKVVSKLFAWCGLTVPVVSTVERDTPRRYGNYVVPPFPYSHLVPRKAKPCL